MTGSKASPPPWFDHLNETISASMKENKDSISYAFSSVDVDGFPQTRFVVHRGFVNQRGSESGEGLKNSPDAGIGQALLTCTDIRTDKVKQLAKNNKVELAWWLEPKGEQYRVQGHAYVLAPPNKQAEAGDFPAKKLAPSEDFDWESERIRIWRKMSPTLRATFVRPKTGVPLDKNDRPSDWRKELGSDLEVESEEDKKDLAAALSNFALIVIDPVRVDWVSLKADPNERAFWTRKEGSEEWQKTDIAP